jgi:PAS domain S-box-containing protein
MPERLSFSSRTTFAICLAGSILTGCVLLLFIARKFSFSQMFQTAFAPHLLAAVGLLNLLLWTGLILICRSQPHKLLPSLQPPALDHLRPLRPSPLETVNTLQALAQVSPLPMVAEDRQGLVTLWNPAAQRVFGWSAAEVQGSPTPLAPIEKPAAFQKMRERVCQGETFSELAVQFGRQDGEVLEMRLSAVPQSDAEGQVTGILYIMEDITARSHAIRDLEESAERFRLIFENAPDAFFLHDVEGHFLDGNRAAEEILGYSREELKGSNLKTMPILAAQQIQEAFAILARARQAQGPASVEISLIKKDGDEAVVEVRTYPVHFQGQDLMLAIARDVTRRRQAEKMMEEAKSQQAAILANIPDMAWLKDLDGRYLAVNEPMARFCGLAPAELLGKTDLDIKPRDLAQRHQEEEDRVLRSGRKLQVEESLKDAQGQMCWLETIRTPIFNEQKEIIGTIGIARDITPRKLAEEALKDNQERVYQAQKMEALGALAGGIAHDFNNLLTPMIGYIELVLGELSSQSSWRHDLEQVLVAGLHAKELVQQILTFSRKTPSELQPVLISEIIEEGVKLLRASIPATIDMVSDLKAPEALVLADPTQLHQVFMNLGTNAYHALRDQGGVLTIGLREEEIREGETGTRSGLEPGSYVVLTVSDTGPGIPPHLLSRIFEPYYTTKEAGEGSGLGLAIVHGIVKEAGGDILVESEVGQGVTFRVFWPRAVAGRQETKPVAEELPTGSECILLVDDDPAVLEVTQRLLERLGYQVTGTTASLEAVQILTGNSQKFDLVLSDITMPHLTGPNLSREIRRIRPDLPIILFTGYSDGCDEERVRQLNVQALVMKPLAISALAQTVRRVLDHRPAA